MLNMNSFDMLVAKLFALLYALAKLRLSKAVKLIKLTNKWIFRIGLVSTLVTLTENLILVSIFILQPDNSKIRTNLESYMVYDKLILFIVQGCA